ncbi:hypothetical protein SAMN05421780_101253 [Flexibacter flexilis DSM 6793]|uniref:Uncharacterized protein n=1 Tax=Flexibacter flexilis DSM 6793 TaxID=927664 RepID=A0A1I1DP78_9BACT|nr:hypothetical protein [Flexibacter flexilis]SFB74858.1 hypothetical protein SAMN05421780_101253 [Flexibacter flexilis DSM 6793]
MKINKENFLPNLFLGENIGQPFWEWENLKFDDGVGRQCFVGELPTKSADFVSYHCGQDLETQQYGIINSNYQIILPFEYTLIKPKNPYFNQSYIKKDTYYFYIWKGNNIGLLIIEGNIIRELIPPIYTKIEQTEHINYYECRTQKHSNLYNLLEEKFLFGDKEYNKITDTPFSLSMFNLYIDSKCILYDYKKQEIVINDLQDIYFINSLGDSLQHKLYSLNETQLRQYNLETYQEEALEIAQGYSIKSKIGGINACPIPQKYKKIIIENYLK